LPTAPLPSPAPAPGPNQREGDLPSLDRLLEEDNGTEGALNDESEFL